MSYEQLLIFCPRSDDNPHRTAYQSHGCRHLVILIIEKPWDENSNFRAFDLNSQRQIIVVHRSEQHSCNSHVVNP